MHATLHTPSATNSKQHEDACDLVMHPFPFVARRTVRPAINRAAAFSETVRDFLNGKPSKPDSSCQSPTSLPKGGFTRIAVFAHIDRRPHWGATQFSTHIRRCSRVDFFAVYAASTWRLLLCRRVVVVLGTSSGVHRGKSSSQSIYDIVAESWRSWLLRCFDSVYMVCFFRCRHRVVTLPHGSDLNSRL